MPPSLLPDPAAVGSLGTNKNLAIDGLPGQVSNVTSTSPNGTYAFGMTITVQVTLHLPVAVDTTGGNPTLALNSRGSGGHLRERSGNTTPGLHLYRRAERPVGPPGLHRDRAPDRAGRVCH